IQDAYSSGQRAFGENYVVELLEKAPALPADIEWHFIGHLQSNKCKQLVKGVPNLALVHSVDSIRLATALDSACKAAGRHKLNVLIQVNTSGEQSKTDESASSGGFVLPHVMSLLCAVVLSLLAAKSGCTPGECMPLYQHILSSCAHLQFHGLMTI